MPTKKFNPEKLKDIKESEIVSPDVSKKKEPDLYGEEILPTF